MSRPYKYILAEDGKTPIATDDSSEWGKWFVRAGMKKIVAQDELPSGVRISTIFLGLDYNFGDGPPLIFETMVFPANSWADGDCERCSTYNQAVEQHEKMKTKYNKEKL